MVQQIMLPIDIVLDLNKYKNETGEIKTTKKGDTRNGQNEGPSLNSIIKSNHDYQ